MKPISVFVESCCLLARNARFPASELYLAYVHWCLQNGVPVMDQFSFLEMMECYGLKYQEKQKKRKKSLMRGISVLPEFRVDP